MTGAYKAPVMQASAKATPVGFCSLQHFQQVIEKIDSLKNKADEEQKSCFFSILGVRLAFNSRSQLSFQLLLRLALDKDESKA